MGVPAFFRWLSTRCPQILLDAIENFDIGELGDFEEEKFLSANFGNPEVDNLYLDMNGIIHPCCNPQNSVRRNL
jgi:5'-3' exoribonuclease 2